MTSLVELLPQINEEAAERLRLLAELADGDRRGGDDERHPHGEYARYARYDASLDRAASLWEQAAPSPRPPSS